MRLHFLSALFAATLFTVNTFAQAPTDQWKKAIVKIESIQQRYNFAQVDVLLHQQVDTIKRLSQHDMYSRQDDLINLKDTIRGTGLLIADGTKIYLITAKHLVKATEKLGTGLETVNDLITIKSNINGKKSNDVSLMNLANNDVHIRPFVFSDDQNDLGIISFQKSNYKAIVAYMKQMGCVPVPVQAIDNLVAVNPGEDVLTVGFPALPGKEANSQVVTTGKIIAANKAGADITLDLKVYPGNSGGPIIKGNKLIGILSYQSGIKNNVDAGMHPYEKASATTAIKASYLLPLLKKLQENEKNPAFNR
jgi:S1-C subfamily serine protease